MQMFENRAPCLDEILKIIAFAPKFNFPSVVADLLQILGLQNCQDDRKFH